MQHKPRNSDPTSIGTPLHCCVCISPPLPTSQVTTITLPHTWECMFPCVHTLPLGTVSVPAQSIILNALPWQGWQVSSQQVCPHNSKQLSQAVSSAPQGGGPCGGCFYHYLSSLSQIFMLLLFFFLLLTLFFVVVQQSLGCSLITACLVHLISNIVFLSGNQ